MNRCSVDGCERRSEARGYCHGHYQRVRRGSPVGGPFPETPLERFVAKVEVNGDCWVWVGATDGDGRYGAFYDSSTGKVMRAHRWAYENIAGEQIEEVLDHLCRRTLCVNPDHLEPVSQHQNILRGGWAPATNARKTHCKRGHEFTPENTEVADAKTGKGRRCRECARMHGRMTARRRRERMKSAA